MSFFRRATAALLYYALFLDLSPQFCYTMLAFDCREDKALQECNLSARQYFAEGDGIRTVTFFMS
jgi:hypothetical protein